MGFDDFLWRKLAAWRSARGLLSDASKAFESGTALPDAPLFEESGRCFLHVGCGNSRKPGVGRGFQDCDWREIRLDIDPAVAPDVVASMLDMDLVPTAAVDGVYSSHNIEHLYPHEVPLALAEFFRVLKPDGLLVLTCPDLQSLCRLVVEDKLDETAYVSPAGAIAPIDVLYGLRSSLAGGNLHMAHRTGFTLKTLVAAVRAAGFVSVSARRRDDYFDLWLLATKTKLSEQELFQLALEHFPP